MEQETPNSKEEAAKPKRGARRWITLTVQALVLLVTLYAIGGHVLDAIKELRAETAEQPLALRWQWLVASVLGYAAGLLLLGAPWWLVLRAYDCHVGLWSATRAYVISHVGKYVPGKAMVIVIRCGLLGPMGVGVAIVTLTSFFETFTAMASGSAVAAVCLTALPLPATYAQMLSERPLILVTVLVLLAGFGGAVLPMGFQWFTKLVTLPFKTAREIGGQRVRLRVLAGALPPACLAWIAWGASYLAVIHAVAAKELGVSALAMTTACVAISIVVGFVSMIPGQAGVRDWILIEALVPVVGNTVAVAAALVFRLVTLLTELLLAGLLYLTGGRS